MHTKSLPKKRAKEREREKNSLRWLLETKSAKTVFGRKKVTMQLLQPREKDKQRKVSRRAKSIESRKCRVSPPLFIKRNQWSEGEARGHGGGGGGVMTCKWGNDEEEQNE